MNLDGVLARAKLVGDLLVEESASDEIADLTFALRQLCEPFGGVSLHALIQLLCERLRSGTRERLQQLWLIDRLHEEVERPFTHRTRCRRHVPSSAQKDDWQGISATPQILLNVEAALRVEPQIEQQTGDV